MRAVISKIMILVLVISMFLQIGVSATSESESVVSVSGTGSYVIRDDGSLWGWGRGYNGSGNGYREVQAEPVQILENVRSVSAFGSGGAAVKKDNSLWAWGSFSGHVFGDGDSSPDRLYPEKVMDDVEMVSVSQYYMLVLKTDKSLWVCGEMTTGDGSTENADQNDGFRKVSDNVLSMYAASDTVYIIMDDNTLWAYGDNQFAQLGNMTASGEDNSYTLYTMEKVLDDVVYVTSSSTGGVTLAIRKDNSLYGWGVDGFYTEEYGWVEDAGQPYKIMDNVLDCSVNNNGNNVFIVKTDKTLWSWGEDYQYDAFDNEKVPNYMTDNVLRVSAGERHAAIVKTGNSLWVMGGNYRNTLGYDIETVWFSPLYQLMDDVQDSPAGWAQEEVELAIGAQLIPDDMQNNYTQPITREEFCILAIRMMEVKYDMTIEEILEERGIEMPSSDTFTDCDTPDVLAAKALGITSGTSATTFDPDWILTREQAAKFLTSTAIACGRVVELSTPAYSDVAEIADWAKPYTGYVYDIGVMKGVGGNRFAPSDSYQRQQAFMTMYRIWSVLDVEE